MIELGLGQGDPAYVAETRACPGRRLAVRAVGIGGDNACGASGAGALSDF